MSVTSDIARAVSQVADPAFRGVLFRALGLAVALLAVANVALVSLVIWLVPDNFSLPWLGEFQSPEFAAALVAIPILLLLSAFVMFPVAAIFIGLFLDTVADAVEARHYPQLAPNRDVPILETLAQGARMAALIVAANLLALVAYGLAFPLAPFLYWGLNGYLLGREFFLQSAVRRMPAREARALRRQNRGQIWALGTILALPMSVPLLNLVVPVIGAAAFTHLFHRLRGT